MTLYNTSCLYSTIKNTSGKSRIFGFIPPHGRTLAANEEYSIFGDIRNALGGNRGPERSVARRDMIAFEAAIASGDLQILETPSQIIVDSVTGDSKILGLASGVLSDIDPCWYDSVS